MAHDHNEEHGSEHADAIVRPVRPPALAIGRLALFGAVASLDHHIGGLQDRRSLEPGR
jgi:hypothetical protein